MNTRVNEESNTYPKLMKSNVSGSIYLMTAPYKGTKLTKGCPDSGYKIGLHSSHWNPRELDDFSGTVELGDI